MDAVRVRLLYFSLVARVSLMLWSGASGRWIGFSE
jgi:hypothetical protein